MSDRLERILALLDGTGQTSTETGYGLAYDGWCARCDLVEPADGGEFCAGCRAFLLGDSDMDPRERVREFRVSYEVLGDAPVWQDLRDSMVQLRAALAVDEERAARLAEQVVALARAAMVPLVEACQAIIDTLTEPAVQAAIESITAAMDTELRRPALVDARGRELALLAERRREARRTNRWGQPPGGRR